MSMVFILLSNFITNVIILTDRCLPHILTYSSSEDSSHGNRNMLEGSEVQWVDRKSIMYLCAWKKITNINNDWLSNVTHFITTNSAPSYYTKQSKAISSLHEASLKYTNKQTNYWPESASQLYQPSYCRLSAKLVPAFADIGCHMVSVRIPMYVFSAF
jgi:hypothetical protein